MSARISEGHQVNRALLQLQARRGEMNQQNIQLSSGQKASTFAEMGEHVERFLSLKSLNAASERFTSTLKTIDQRLDSQVTATQDLNKIAGEFKARLTSVANSTQREAHFSTYVHQTLENVERLLNIQGSDGLYLFSGQSGNVPPVDIKDPAWPTPDLGDAVDYGYAHGSDDNLKGLIHEGQALSYGVNAHELGFSSLLHALKLAGNTNMANPAPSDYAKIREAISHMDTACQDIPASLEKLGLQQRMVESTTESHKTVMDYTKDETLKINQTDWLEAYSKFSQNEVAMKASYHVSQLLMQEDGFLDYLK